MFGRLVERFNRWQDKQGEEQADRIIDRWWSLGRLAMNVLSFGGGAYLCWHQSVQEFRLAPPSVFDQFISGLEHTNIAGGFALLCLGVALLMTGIFCFSVDLVKVAERWFPIGARRSRRA